VSSLALPVPFQVSFEFFPPKTEEMEAHALDVRRTPGPARAALRVGDLRCRRLHPRAHACHRASPPHRDDPGPAAHLTCVSATRDEIDDVAREYWETGVRHLVALRGDPVAGVGTAYEPHPGGYAYASDLVEGLRKVFDFELSVSAYPETHPAAGSMQAEIDNLKRKVDAGATRAITQFFFDNAIYLRYVEKARAAGITVPIVPGIMPVTNFAQTRRFAAMCGTSVPESMARHFEGLEEDADTRKLVAATLAAEQCTKLADEGVEDFHFYTLNRADLAYAICHILGLRATRTAAPAIA
jgi:methylenetetrahydrofolate reductase (NADPH)